MKLFTGSYTHALDAKNRVAVPRKILEVLARVGSDEQVVLTIGFDGCLHLYPPAEFERLSAAVHDSPSGDVGVRRFGRVFFASAYECPLDKNGRMLVPPQLKEQVGLEDKVVFAGAGQYVELWNPDRWNEEQKASFPEYESRAKEVLG